MGIFRKLYREARDILGMKPPAENETQLAERVCDEVKSELGGKKTQEGEDWKLVTNQGGRSVEIVFDAAGARALFSIPSNLEDGPTFIVHFDASGGKDPAPRGAVRIKIGSSIFLEGPKGEAETQEQMWKALPTGTRANLSGLVTKYQGPFGYDESTFRFAPETQTLVGPSAKYNVKMQLTSLLKLCDEIETAWNAL
ncbi:MAG: hypothetical protein IT385_10240 [Deltaproteobacteria bacterium]|nr:hypothetical protein [Deltaproteobacteria bacterium]